MRVLFAGTPDFAIPALAWLCDRTNLVAVLTQPDRPAGRGRKPVPSPVKQYALSRGIPVLCPETLNAESREELQQYAPELMICAAYGRFFGEKFLSLFPLGSVNVHPSLLPRYRGPSPIAAALAAGDEYTGVSLQKIAQEMDCGDLILQSQRRITPSHDLGTLSRDLAEDAVALLARLMDNYTAYYAAAQPQAHSKAVYTLKLCKDHGQLLWVESAEQIARLVRAFAPPFSGVKVRYNGALLKLWKVTVLSDADCLEAQSPEGSEGPEGFESPEGLRDSGLQSAGLRGAGLQDGRRELKVQPGTVLGTHRECGIIVRTVRNCLGIQELQLANKKRMDWKTFLHGQKNFIGTVLC